eukprot:3759698-Amphidinium_carterae.1
MAIPYFNPLWTKRNALSSHFPLEPLLHLQLAYPEHTAMARNRINDKSHVTYEMQPRTILKQFLT